MVKLKIPPPVYMLLIGVLMWLLNRYLPIITVFPEHWRKLALLPILLAILLDATALIQFFRAHTSFNPIHPEKSKQLVTTGLYRLSRNPMYLGLLCWLIGWGILLGSLSCFLMLPMFIWLITTQQIIPEEAILAEKFAEQYQTYQQSVRRWL
jgi:protein-S-isoprenylcysteine O-methyltransferase Ste14